jgi:25S rRNA (uracil2634-N3)-methyltransferase
MIIEKNWRILTVGDGDLSFSLALQKHYQPALLCASIFDSETELANKYGKQHYDELHALEVPTFTEVDVTQPDSFTNLPLTGFDLVIFQFPLLPSYTSFDAFKNRAGEANTNILNRDLLHTFLRHCSEYWLDPQGSGLIYIRSKDVKPYSDWDLENAIEMNTACRFIGLTEFDSEQFPGYRIRNVDRDKHVKNTAGTTYVYTTHPQTEIQRLLTISNKQRDKHCLLCGTGPYNSEQDRQSHSNSKRHRKLLKYDRQWNEFLLSKYQ